MVFFLLLSVPFFALIAIVCIGAFEKNEDEEYDEDDYWMPLRSYPTQPNNKEQAKRDWAVDDNREIAL